jgi:hypothetical protein
MVEPEKVPPKMDVNIARHQIINGDLYINLDDLTSLMKIMERDYKIYATTLLTTYGLMVTNIASDYVMNSLGVKEAYQALEEFANQAKFENIVGEEDEQ